jgi:tetratricopeptide (TPR) repeat protein
MFAQKTNVDSLLKVWNNKSLADTVRLKAMDDLAWDGYLFTNPDSAFYFAQLEFNFALAKNNKKYEGKALSTQAFALASVGKNEKAIDYNMRSLKIREEIGDKKGVAASLNNLGSIYCEIGDFSKGIDFYVRSLKILEETNDRTGLTGAYDNIGTLYFYQGNYEKATEYENKSIAIGESLGDSMNLQFALCNLGLIYQIHKDYVSAIHLYERCLKIDKQSDNTSLLSTILGNLGSVHYSNGDTAIALDYFNRCLKISREINNKGGISVSLNNIGVLYKDEGNYTSAIKYSSEALSIGRETGEAAQLREASNSLYCSYKKTGRFTEALAMHELYVQTLDRVRSAKAKKEIVRQEFKYEYEKKAAADSVRTIEKNKLIAIQFKEVETQRYALYGGVLLLLVFGGFMFNRYRVTQKQKEVMELQKNLVEEKQREILDSIYYARRIQRSLLPTEKYIEKNLNRLKTER